MNERKFTDEEIIKALECCVKDDIIDSPNHEICFECPLKYDNDCSCNLRKRILDLVNRQKEEIEKLRKLDELAETCIENQNLMIAQLRSDIITEKQIYEHIKGLWAEEKEKVAKAKQKVIDACKMKETIKVEAIKEFAERLKEELRLSTGNNGGFVPSMIDNLVKEMTEGENEC